MGSQVTRTLGPGICRRRLHHSTPTPLASNLCYTRMPCSESPDTITRAPQLSFITRRQAWERNSKISENQLLGMATKHPIDCDVPKCSKHAASHFCEDHKPKTNQNLQSVQCTTAPAFPLLKKLNWSRRPPMRGDRMHGSEEEGQGWQIWKVLSEAWAPSSAEIFFRLKLIRPPMPRSAMWPCKEQREQFLQKTQAAPVFGCNRPDVTSRFMPRKGMHGPSRRQISLLSQA